MLTAAISHADAQVFAIRALRDARPIPLWQDDLSRPTAEPPLLGTNTADLVIVGGGLTGLWAALIAKELQPGVDVVLLESGRIAQGASSRAGGIISTSIMHGLANEARVFPRDVSTLEQLGRNNLRAVRDTIARLGIECDVEWTGEMKVAVREAHLPLLLEEYELHRRHGHDVVMLDQAGVRAQVNSPAFVSAMWSRQDSGIVNPARLAWGLKAAALACGVRIHEMSTVQKLSDSGTAVLLRTTDGEVRAPRVLLATNAWGGLVPAVRRRMLAAHDQVIATAPLTNEQLSRVGWRGRQGLYDTRTQLNYTRLTRDNRLVFGGHVGYFFGNRIDPPADRDTATFTQLAATFFQTFPQLSDVEITHVWGGPIDYCKRLAMFFQRFLRGKVMWVGGYSGFGVAGSRFGALTALDLLFGRETPAALLDIARTMPGRIPPEPLRWLGATLTNQALARADRRAGWQSVIRVVRALGYPI